MKPEQVTICEDDCASFGSGWNKDVRECIDCGKEVPEQYEECKKRTNCVLDSMDKPEIVSNVKGKKMDTNENVQVESGQNGNVSDKKPSMKQWCREMIAEGYEIPVIKTALADDYIANGKDKKYAYTRANAIYGDVSKKLKAAGPSVASAEVEPEDLPVEETS